ncbi:MAG: hypothetical protein ACI9M9_001464 [Flavobacteriaceae bacterium]|jgi:hypothetical protein
MVIHTVIYTKNKKIGICIFYQPYGDIQYTFQFIFIFPSFEIELCKKHLNDFIISKWKNSRELQRLNHLPQVNCQFLNIIVVRIQIPNPFHHLLFDHPF